jgi:hypothetical protein
VPGLAITITLIQIIQMVIGVGLLAYRTTQCDSLQTPSSLPLE